MVECTSPRLVSIIVSPYSLVCTMSLVMVLLLEEIFSEQWLICTKVALTSRAHKYESQGDESADCEKSSECRGC